MLFRSALAAACTTFSVDWKREQRRRFPTPAEIGAFISDYESGRARFTSGERRRLATSMVTTLAYGARCEHAVDHRPDANDGQRVLLARLGPPLLAEGLGALSS